MAHEPPQAENQGDAVHGVHFPVYDLGRLQSSSCRWPQLVRVLPRAYEGGITAALDREGEVMKYAIAFATSAAMLAATFWICGEIDKHSFGLCQEFFMGTMALVMGSSFWIPVIVAHKAEAE